MSTAGLFGLLAHFSKAKKHSEHMARCRGLSRMLAERLLAPNQLAGMCLEKPPDCAKNLFDTEPVIEGVCACMSGIRSGFESSAQVSPQAAVPMMLRLLYDGLVCPGVRAWAGALLLEVGARAAERAGEWTDYRWHASEDAVVQGPQKRRRTDPHVKHHAMVTACQTGSSSTPSMACRTLSGVDRHQACRWQLGDMAAYLASCRLSFAGCAKGSVSVCMDASRLGIPSRDFLLGVFTDLRSDRHCVLALQAHRCVGGQVAFTESVLWAGGYIFAQTRRVW